MGIARPSDPRRPPKAEIGGEEVIPLNKGTLLLDNNCWKLTRDVEGG